MYSNTFTNSTLRAYSQIQPRCLVPPTNNLTLNQFTNTVDTIAGDFSTTITEVTLNGYCDTLNARSRANMNVASVMRLAKT